MDQAQLDRMMAASQSEGGGAGMVVTLVIELAIAALVIASMWKVFTKAGQPGWGAIVPIYNLYLLCKVVGKPGWWVVLMLIPCVNFVVFLLVMLDLAKAFGKGAGFGIGLWLLSFVFLPILGFGDAQYQKALPA